MALGDAGLWLTVTGWHHDVTHDGEKFSWKQMRVNARTKADEEMVIGAEGFRRMTNMWFSLSIVRSRPEKPTERGIGVMGWHAAREADGDIPDMEEFVGGWFWLPEDLHDEVWRQTTEHHYDAATLELHFGPAQAAGMTSRWNVETNATVPILQAGVNFERKLAPIKDLDKPKEPSRRRGLYWCWG